MQTAHVDDVKVSGLEICIVYVKRERLRCVSRKPLGVTLLNLDTVFEVLVHDFVISPVLFQRF